MGVLDLLRVTRFNILIGATLALFNVIAHIGGTHHIQVSMT
jgi:hypothetical protein